jgi:hypothetical protein
VMITSSLLPISRAFSASSKASVPLATTTAWLTPNHAANSFSNFLH